MYFFIKGIKLFERYNENWEKKVSKANSQKRIR